MAIRDVIRFGSRTADLPYGRIPVVAAPKVIPTLDDTPKAPRIIPKRCPACQRPNKPEAVKCGTCGYLLDAPPPIAGQHGAKPGRRAGGVLKTALMVLPFLAVAGGAGVVVYFGVDRSFAFLEGLYKKAPPPPTAGQKAQTTALDARKNTLNRLKDEAGSCFTQFNDLMERGNKPVDPGPMQQALQKNSRELESLGALNLGCNDTNSADAIKLESCDTVVQLKTCLSTVMNMQRERLAAAAKAESSK
jgi:hypothetical protein